MNADNMMTAVHGVLATQLGVTKDVFCTFAATGLRLLGVPWGAADRVWVWGSLRRRAGEVGCMMRANYRVPRALVRHSDHPIPGDPWQCKPSLKEVPQGVAGSCGSPNPNTGPRRWGSPCGPRPPLRRFRQCPRSPCRSPVRRDAKCWRYRWPSTGFPGKLSKT